MAAATENSRNEWVAGNKRCVSANLTVDNTYTYVTGLGRIDALSVTPTTAAALGATYSGGTITFASGGSLTCNVIVHGA